MAGPKAGGAGRHNQAPRRAGGAKPSQTHTPMPTAQALLIGALAGAVIGGLIVSLFWISQDKECPPPPEVEECPEAKLVAPPVTGNRTGEDFYRVLPIAGIPDNQDDEAEKKDPYIYHLQAGSFKSRDDAGAQQAELALIGFEATVTPFVAASGTTWHRVRVGPFTSKREAGKVKREIWERAKIDATRLQQRAP